MPTRNIRAHCHWYLSLLAWAGAAAVPGLLAGCVFGLLAGALLGGMSGNTAMALAMIGRGAFAGLATGAILGVAAKLLDDDGGADSDFPNEWGQWDHSPSVSTNGKLTATTTAQLQGSKPHISSR
jgi:Na+/proline symporter